MKAWFAQRSHIVLVGILVVGLVLRLWQINYGLPRVLFTDELFFGGPATKIADGSMNPGWFGAPASPQIYAVGLTWRIQNYVINLKHHTHLTATSNMAFAFSDFYVVGRLWSVVMGMVGVWFLFLIGRRQSERVGVWAAALGSLNWYLIEQSHIIRPDIWQTTFLLGLLWAVLHIFEKPNILKWYGLSGIFLGLAMTEKYTSVLVLALLPVMVWLLSKQGNLRWNYMWIATAVTVATVFLSAPFIFIHPYRAIHDIGFEILQAHNVHSNRGFFGNMQLYLQSLDWELGTLLSLIGLGAFVVARKKKIFVGAAGAAFVMALAYLILISVTRQAWDRWMIPVMTLLLVPLAVGVDWLLQQKKKWIVMMVLVLCLAAPTLRLVRLMAGLQLPYSSELVRTWFIEHAASDANIVSDPYGPVLSGPFLYDEVGTIGGQTPAQLKKQGTQYVVATQDILTALQGMAKRTKGSSSYSKVAKGYDTIAATFPLVYSTLPPSGQTSETTIWANDFLVFKTLALDVPRGSVYRVYRVQ